MASSLLAGLSILVIGDRHMVTSYDLIGGPHDDLPRKGASVHSIGICPGDWLKATPGTACGAAERRSQEPLVSLHGKASTAKDKPDLEVAQIYAFLTSNVAPCRHIGSLLFSRPGQRTTPVVST